MASCTVGMPASPSCDELIILQGQISRQASAEEMRAWIAQTYHITPESIALDPVPQLQAQLLTWKNQGLWYHLDMDVEKGIVTGVGVDTAGLTASDTIACLGQPSMYSATYGYETEGGTQLNLDLLFAERGILVGGARILRDRPQEPPAITGSFLMNGVRFMPAGSAVELVQQLGSEYVPGLREQVIKGYKPWPGDWKDVQVTPFVSPP